MTKENTRKTSEKKIRIFGRIDEETWKRWKKTASDRGMTFTEFASKAIEKLVATKL